MALRWYSVVWDCRDPRSLAAWWATVLDWVKVYETNDEVVIVPEHVALGAGVDGAQADPLKVQGQGWVFVPVPEGKTVKNRLHIDLAPLEGESQADAVDRLVGLGATRANVGQDEDKVTWVVLHDPEGNEFCILSPRN